MEECHRAAIRGQSQTARGGTGVTPVLLQAWLGGSPDQAPEGMAAPKSNPSNEVVLEGERLIIIGSKECASLTKAKGFFITVQLQLGRQC